MLFFFLPSSFRTPSTLIVFGDKNDSQNVRNLIDFSEMEGSGGSG